VLTADLGEQVDPNRFLPISQEALDQQGGMDYWSPENTAQRIVDGSTAFFSSYQTAHPELQGDALVNGFLDVIGGGIKQGFEQAKGILGEMKVLEGDIKSNVDLTYQKVLEGLEAFKNQHLGNQPVNETQADNIE